MATDHSNDIVVEAWNTVLFDKFVRFKHLLVDGLSQHSDAALARGDYAPGQRVLDVGCGFGDSTLRIAEMVGSDGEAVGMDCAVNFISEAEKEAATAAMDNARFFTGAPLANEFTNPQPFNRLSQLIVQEGFAPVTPEQLGEDPQPPAS